MFRSEAPTGGARGAARKPSLHLLDLGGDVSRRQEAGRPSPSVLFVPNATHRGRLGPVDEFGEGEGKAESDEGTIVPGSFLATESDALET